MNIPPHIPIYIAIVHETSDLHFATLTIAQTNGNHLTLDPILLTTEQLTNLAALLITCPNVTCGLTPDPPLTWPVPASGPGDDAEMTGNK